MLWPTWSVSWGPGQEAPLEPPESRRPPGQPWAPAFPARRAEPPRVRGLHTPHAVPRGWEPRAEPGSGRARRRGRRPELPAQEGFAPAALSAPGRERLAAPAQASAGTAKATTSVQSQWGVWPWLPRGGGGQAGSSVVRPQPGVDAGPWRSRAPPPASASPCGPTAWRSAGPDGPDPGPPASCPSLGAVQRPSVRPGDEAAAPAVGPAAGGR